MKDRPFSVLRRAACVAIVLSSLPLASCSRSGDFPAKDTESLVTRHLDGACKLSSVLEHTPLAPVNDQQRVAVRYEADCLPEGGQSARRIRYVMTFEQHAGWLSKNWVRVDNAAEPDPPAAPTTAAHAARDAIAATATEWSEAPECNAVLKRVATEVMPCLTAADANVAAEIEQWLERARVDYRLHGDVSQRELALLRIDDDCLQQWRYRNKLIGEEARLRQCALR